MNKVIFAFSYSITAFGHIALIETAAKDLANRLFPTQGKWAIKSSEIFVTLFFSDKADADDFASAWLSQTIALPICHMSSNLRFGIEAYEVSTAKPQATVLPDA